jgi:hypothetical protein
VIEVEEQDIKEEKEEEEEEDFPVEEEAILEEICHYAEILIANKDANGEINANIIILIIPRAKHMEDKNSKEHFKILRINRTLTLQVEQEDQEDIRVERKSVLMV